MSRSRVYVGNLPPNVRERDIEDIFRKYGKINQMDLRTNKGPPFAFLDFDDSRDADDAIHGRDGYDLDGYRIRVEHPRSLRDNDRTGGFRERGRDNGGYGGRSGGGYPGGGGYGRRNDGLRRSKYRVVVTGLPISGSWQDLKDHMREAGDVCFADVHKDGTGHVEFLKEEDMKYAIKKLDDTKFRSHEGETGYIRIKIDDGGTSSSRARSRSRSRSGSPADRRRSRSPIDRRSSPKAKNGSGGRDRGETKRERSPTHSRSPSPKREARAASASRSRSASPNGQASRSPSRERE
ncbi:hypothetical protein RvY_04718 [Ramazzottius varieornatus]|uniref:RRM domain-containing protein n=1 Tax=Ramazzottius varieornatus TaxID=947166 RepID=A0A1D1USL6_RAMVA|nr:hypothetical protein RvY_04718 [Ramazzottius varieornatus]